MRRFKAGLASAPVAGFMVTYNKHTLSLEDLGTLEEQNWVNDQVRPNTAPPPFKEGRLFYIRSVHERLAPQRGSMESQDYRKYTRMEMVTKTNR